MSVQRLSFAALKKILEGKLKEKATCVVKFYSGSCRYCHALKDYYEDISHQYEDVYFFAFEHTWYRSTDITNFIERYKNG